MKFCLSCGVQLFPKKFQHALLRCPPCAASVWAEQRREGARRFKAKKKAEKPPKMCERRKVAALPKRTWKYCVDCRPLARKEGWKAYQEANAEKYKKRYREKHLKNYTPVEPHEIVCKNCGNATLVKNKRVFCNKKCKKAFDLKMQKENYSPEQNQVNHNKRRARKQKTGGSYTAKQWKLLCDLLGNQCFDCGRQDVKLTVGHAIPLSKGGSSFIYNLIPQCMPCNGSQGTKIHPSFLGYEQG